MTYFSSYFFYFFPLQEFSLLVHLAIFRNVTDQAISVLVLSTSIVYYQKQIPSTFVDLGGGMLQISNLNRKWDLSKL